MNGDDGAIHVLDTRTINQIAAGEVVERPASVVKELVENAIDAGAHLIRVEVNSDRRHITGIRVTDDGIGMGRGDAVLAFKEHATSKIRAIDDLDSVLSLGFRGEALPSIASVAEVALVTRPRGGDVIAGTRVRIRGGAAPEVSETGAPEGTSVEVHDLFYNTPARSKFLKSLHTELAHISGVIERTALSRPDIAFRLIHNGRERIATHPATDLKETVTELFGASTAEKLVPVSASSPAVRIGGYVSGPALSRADPYQIFLSVNGRPISSFPIVRAIRDGYGTLLPKDRFPVAFLHLQIDGGRIDVNVHPTKKQVRFSNEAEICDIVREGVQTALNNGGQSGAAPFHGGPATTAISHFIEKKREIPGFREPAAPFVLNDRRLRQSELPLAGAERNRLPEITVIGQVDRTYIIGEAENRSLVIIDQHAAHERIVYEQVSERDSGGGRSQELIIPVLITVSPQEDELMREALPALSDEGFAVEEFGPVTYAVNAIPVILGKLEEAEVIRDLVSALVREGPADPVGKREEIRRRVACRAAIKAGEDLSMEQMRRLIQQLSYTKQPYTCPHGRPTIITYSTDELAGMFRRT
ncbi:DNA mismatch repair endonuclease MutL [Methanofollis fontis]|uniref:DNA mismatch repair protein MutL n=1 Tax=Methanofollis fontis TaxID=2052832 RepID=A0A483CMB8_9EURY|nr:DNA mismatch repair endonuclease MutL [Methanofollis fontis]TAJ44037.1 DNA mismatch repair protein MutL [Methanofollis fontis]